MVVIQLTNESILYQCKWNTLAFSITGLYCKLAKAQVRCNVHFKISSRFCVCTCKTIQDCLCQIKSTGMKIFRVLSVMSSQRKCIKTYLNSHSEGKQPTNQTGAKSLYLSSGDACSSYHLLTLEQMHTRSNQPNHSM